MSRPLKVLFAGGGTGGHVFPLVAVADAVRELSPSTEVVFVGSKKGMEARIIPERGDPLELLHILPLRGHGFGGMVRGAVRAAAVLPETVTLVRRLRPDIVLSIGGYAAGPVVLAARGLGIPVTILEPNSLLGFTNWVVTPLVKRAYVCFPETRAKFRAGKALWLGVPLRQRFEPAPYEIKADGSVEILVVGGSQGAQAINEALPAAASTLLAEGLPLTVVHQTGRDKDGPVREQYRELEIEHAVQVMPFIDNMAAALAAADLVLCRSGAGTTAELCAVGRASIAVPYPYAADDHQRKNAESLERDGAAVCIPQAQATSERLTTELRELITNGELRRSMARKAAARGRPDAARNIARDLIELASQPQQRVTAS